MPRTPTTHLIGNLRFTDSGTVWADFLLQGRPYKFTTTETKRRVRDTHTALFRALPGESLLLGVTVVTDPGEVVDRMLGKVDLDAAPQWAELALATYDSLSEIPLGRRVYWLSVPLSTGNWIEKARRAASAAWNRFIEQVGLPRELPPAEVIAEYEQLATDIARRIPSFRPKPATPAQSLWLHEHMINRGLFLDDQFPTSGGLTDDLVKAASPRGAAGEPLLDEGGMSDFPSVRGRAKAIQRPLIKVTNTTRFDAEPSYQAIGLITKPPVGGMVFPGSELLGCIDESGVPVDWALRLNVVGRAKTAKANQDALNTLNDQRFHAGDTDNRINRGTDLDTRERALREYVSLLAGDELEVETWATIIFAIAAPDRATLREQAQTLESWVKDSWHHKLLWPLGHQETLWWDMHPGIPTSKVSSDFKQITTTKMLAGLVPLIDTSAGDRNGHVVAVNLANGPMLDENLPTGVTGVILHDLAGAPERDTAGSVGVAAESGAGKSVLLKGIADANLDQGGGAVIVDRTEMGEYAIWAAARDEDVAVVEIIHPVASLDPLRVFPGAEGSRVAQSFLTTLLNISPTTELGATLSHVLDATFRERHGIHALGDLPEFLEGSDLAEADTLARRMRVFSSKDIGRAVFDPTIPPIDPTRSVVLRTNQLELPTEQELTHEHLFNQLTVEKLFGRAYYSLIAGHARHACFRDRSTMWVFCIDELTMQIASPEVEAYIKEFNLDGRKHRGAVICGVQFTDNGGLGSHGVADTFPTRVVMRMRQRNQAVSALRWMLGLGESAEPDEELVELISTDTAPIQDEDLSFVLPHRRGEMLFRDASGRVARGKVLASPIKARYDAAMATGFEGAK